MFFFSGSGLAGLAAAEEACKLPPAMRTGAAGVSGGALGALAVSLGNHSTVLEALDASGWPGDPSALHRALDSRCSWGLSFGTWHLRRALPFCVLAFDCDARRPVLFSASTTPQVSVAEAVAAAAAWPGASGKPALVEGRPHCDVEFFLSPLDLFAQLRPPRALALLGTQPSLISIAGRLADNHAAFMAALRRPCVGFVARVSGPHVLDSVLRRESAASMVNSHKRPWFSRTLLRCGLWLFLTVVLGILLAQGSQKVNTPVQSPAAVLRALKRKQRRWIWRMGQTPVRSKGSVKGGKGQ